MNARIYDIKYNKLVAWLLPVPLRKAVHNAWLLALTSPVVKLYQALLRYRQAKLYQLTITPQVCYLQRMLNDRFDPTLRRILLSDGIWRQPWYVYQEAELKPRYLYTEAEDDPVITYTDSEAGQLPDDFVVYVPIGLIYDITEMRGLLNAYKLAGTRYKIESY